MTVHDCIKEYEILGDKIFGHPRPCSWFGILWPKYSSGRLRKVINDVTARHSTIGYILNYEIEKDLAQWYVSHFMLLSLKISAKYSKYSRRLPRQQCSWRRAISFSNL